MKRTLGGLAAVLAVLALLGWFWWILRSQTIEYRVDLGNLLSCTVTLVVALVIGYLYSEQASTRKGDTDFLLDSVREAKGALHELHEAARPFMPGKTLSDTEQTKLTRAERGLSNAVHSLEYALSHCKIGLHTLDFDKLKDSRVALKDLLTDSPFPGPYDAARCGQIDANFKAMRDELIRVGIAINHRK